MPPAVYRQESNRAYDFDILIKRFYNSLINMETASFTPRIVCDRALGRDAERVDVDEAAILDWMQKHGLPPDQVNNLLIYLSNDRPVDYPIKGKQTIKYGDCTIFGDEDNNTIISVYCGWVINQHVAQQEGDDVSTNDASIPNSRLTATLYHELTHRQVYDRHPAIAKAAEKHTKLFSMIKEAGSLAVRGALATMVAATALAAVGELGRMGVNREMVLGGAICAGAIVATLGEIVARKLTTRFDAFMAVKEYQHDPEEKICRAAEGVGPSLISITFKDNFAERYQPAACITFEAAAARARDLLFDSIVL